jgi:hypothetical protein
VRFELTDSVARLQEVLVKIRFWRWEIARLPQKGDNCPYDVLYVGRKAKWELAKILLGIDVNVDIGQVGTHITKRTMFVSEVPMPGALRVPCALRVIIPLGKPIDEVTAGFDKKLRRVLRNQRATYRTQQALDDAEITRADQMLLQPYANARHGTAAHQISSNEVMRIAKNPGRLDLVLSGDEVVGCILGCEITRSRKHYWGLIRCGYPEVVFSDPIRLRETNAINFYLALEWAINNGFDYFDMGTCLARPEDGLLQWKKRWGGLVDTMGNHSCLYVRLPSIGAAQLLWDAPLFAVERNNLTLHLGLPEGQNDEEFSLRYREMNRGMGIGGLFKVYLHYARPPGEILLQTLRSHYAHLKSPPIIASIPSN